MRSLLTPKQKDAIRALPCVLCLAVPPFADGSPCHVHRILRGKDGGQYTRENVIPLCPSCHYAVDRVACLNGAAKGGRRSHELHPDNARTAGRKGGLRVQALYPAVQRENGRRVGLERMSHLTATERSALARTAGAKGTEVRKERIARDGLTGNEIRRNAGNRARGVRVHQVHPELRANLRLRWIGTTAAERSANGRKAAATRRARAHIRLTGGA